MRRSDLCAQRPGSSVTMPSSHKTQWTTASGEDQCIIFLIDDTLSRLVARKRPNHVETPTKQGLLAQPGLLRGRKQVHNTRVQPLVCAVSPANTLATPIPLRLTADAIMQDLARGSDRTARTAPDRTARTAPDSFGQQTAGQQAARQQAQSQRLANTLRRWEGRCWAVVLNPPNNKSLN